MPTLPESLLSDSTVWLFGRVLLDLTFANKEERAKHYTGRGSATQLLRDELLSDDPQLARVYAFAFQNELFDMVKPALFVVNGPGTDLAGGVSKNSSVGTLGVGQIGGLLASDLKGWAYDRDDFSVRLDVMTGPFDRILLDYELADEGFQPFAPRGGGELGRPGPMGGRRRGRRSRRWRAEDE